MNIMCVNCGEEKGKAYDQCPATHDGMGAHEWNMDEEDAAELEQLTPEQKRQLAQIQARLAGPLDYQGE